MKAFSCFVLVFLSVSSHSIFGFPSNSQKEAEQSASGNANAQQDASVAKINLFPNDDFVSMSEFMKNAQRRIAQLEESVINEFKQHAVPFDPMVHDMQNRTAKQIKIFDNKFMEMEEKIVSTGTKENGTIAIYKLIKFRPLSNAQEQETVESANPPQNADKTHPTPDKTQVVAENPQEPITKVDLSAQPQPAPAEQPAQNEQQTVPSSERPVQSEQPAQVNDPGETIEQTAPQKQAEVKPAAKKWAFFGGH